MGENKWLVLALLATLPLAIACAFERHLAMDGVNVLVQVLETHGFFVPAPTRVLALGLRQWPVVVGVWCGVRDMPALIALWGLGIMLPFWCGLALSWRSLPVGRKHFMALPIATLVTLHYAMDGGLVFEGHVMAALVWPALFFMLRREPWSRIDAVLMFAILVVLAFSYEAVVFPGLLLAGLAVRRRRAAREREQGRLALAAGLLALFGAAVAVSGIIMPADSGNRASFLAASFDPWRYPLAWTGAVVLVLVAWGWTRGGTAAMRAIGVIGAAAAICWVLGWMVPWPGPVYPLRTLFLTLLAPLLVGGAWLFAREVPLPRGGFALWVCLTVALSVPLFGRLGAWADYREKIRQVVQTKRGLIAVAATPVLRDSQRDSWNLPQLCLVWSWPQVRAIILNPPEIPWEPFDPRRERPLRGYLRYEAALSVAPVENPP